MSRQLETSSRRRSSSALAATGTLALAISAWSACSKGAVETSSVPPTARVAREPAYVDDALCIGCHAEAAKAWTGSQHDLAMQPATEATVLGDFGGVEFTSNGVKTTFRRRDGGFIVDTAGRDGKPAEYRVEFTFGVAPLQQYLVAADEGRVQCLTIAWDTVTKRWFDLYPDEHFGPRDELHWTGRYQRWNSMCAQCHSTDVEKRYDPARDGYATRYSAIDVGCQACHGPGAEHVAIAQRGEAKPNADGLTVVLRHGEQRAQLDTCGPCHAMRSPITERWVHGEPMLDHFVPELLRAGSYLVDGQMQDEAYVWGSFLQSKMAQRGVACTDCHDPHSLALRGMGNQVCQQCHQVAPPLNRFPTLKPKNYDSSEHHHHAAGSTGASCVACHMPAKTFMRIDTRHDHSFRIPRPDLSETLGTPNTCNDCHRDRDATWAAKAAREWWPESRKRAHFSQAFQLARAGDDSALDRIVRDPEQPAIVRATACELYGSGTGAVEISALADPDALVRLGAVRALEPLLSPDSGASKEVMNAASEAVVARLADPVRAVRVEAARIACALDANRLTPVERANFDRAFDEFVAAQGVMADFPAAHSNLALVHARRGDIAKAEVEYRAALRLDPCFLPARFDLAQMLDSASRAADAETVLRGGLACVPDDVELLHALGLVLAELKRAGEAADALARASRLAPGNGGFAFDAGLALMAAERRAEAEEVLVLAASAAPNRADIRVALVQHFTTSGQWARALPYAEQLVRLVPDDSGAREVLEHVRAEVAKQR